MPDPTPISTPSGYAPAYAVGYADPSSNLILVSQQNPLPVASETPDAPPPLVGQTAASVVAGPFAAVADRVITVTLEGGWTGSARLRRSLDGGATLHDLRVAGLDWAVFTRSGSEQAWVETEHGATYYLDIQLASGSLAYRVSQ